MTSNDNVSFTGTYNYPGDVPVGNPTIPLNMGIVLLGAFQIGVSATVTITINSITFNNTFGSFWLGGDRLPVKLKDAEEGDWVSTGSTFSGGANISFSADREKVRVWLQKWNDVSDSTGSYWQFDTNGPGFTKDDYSIAMPPVPDVNDWRSYLVTMTVDPTLLIPVLTGDSCVDFYMEDFGGDFESNIQEGKLYVTDPSQGTFPDILFIDLINGITAEGYETEVSDVDGTGVSCVLSNTTMEPLEGIIPIVDETEPEYVELLGIVTYLL
jgi:hypothetical protein